MKNVIEKSECCNAKINHKEATRFVVEAQDGGHYVTGEAPVCSKCNQVCVIIFKNEIERKNV